MWLLNFKLLLYLSRLEMNEAEVTYAEIDMLQLKSMNKAELPAALLA